MCQLCGDFTRVIPLEVLECGHVFHTDCLRGRRKSIKYTCAVCDAWDFHEEAGGFGTYNPRISDPDVLASARAKMPQCLGEIADVCLTLPEYIEMLRASRDPDSDITYSDEKNKKYQICGARQAEQSMTERYLPEIADSSSEDEQPDQIIKNELDIFDARPDWDFPWFITLVIILYIILRPADL
jgi:hypothetical protein